ncbi:MAG: DUF1848 domain-containing protein [Spirochaetaceae bacterium]|jgi:hypothetical protein|nr:DUF1848 domain-containing protein [Spirochaetaceae bacterium]
MIISVSRRGDIPRFHFDWFMERLGEGFTETVNPFNAAQVRRVSLLPEDAEVLVFWTRDPGVIARRAEELGGRRYYVMTTLTGYGPLLEPNMPPPEAVIAAIRDLAGMLGPERLIWRYDPLFLSDETDRAFHLRNFRALSRALRGAVSRVITSVYDEYGGSRRRIAALERAGALRPRPHYTAEGAWVSEVRLLAADLAGLAAEAGMELRTCAEGEEAAELGIAAGACIDGELIRRLWGIEAGCKDRNQRPRCRCAPSVDIGRYGSCPAGCVYCYARR